ncbi:MAG: RNA polymerase subunit sigma-70 [Acidobacteria bacterium]|nr:MAG: RNA polymerase subunit sigma-70 [Acidobacteriota bacterium]PYY05326.1 MAG: RNA polymerase subunit sigma-70 [Acidobacteriota bacterium]
MGTALTIGAARYVTQGIAAEDFDEIVRQHQRRVYRVLFLLLRNSDAADTLTQECFVRAYEKRSSFRGESRIATWLLQIAVNLARDYARNRRAGFWKRLIGFEDAAAANAPTQFPDPQASPERALLARRELQAVWAAAAELSPQQRAIFLLRFGEELSLQEISEVLGLKLGCVKAHLFRALGTVRRKLKEQQWR